MNEIQNHKFVLKKINPHFINIAIMGIYFLFDFSKIPIKNFNQLFNLFGLTLTFLGLYFIDQLLVRLIFLKRIKDNAKFTLYSFLSLFITLMLLKLFYRDFESLHFLMLIAFLIRPAILSCLMNKNILNRKKIFISSLGVLVVGVLDLIIWMVFMNYIYKIFTALGSFNHP